MDLRTFNAGPDYILLQIQDDSLDFEDIEISSDLKLMGSRATITRMETEGTVKADSRKDGAHLFRATYPDARAAAIFIESGQIGELDLEAVKLVRTTPDMTLSIKPQDSSLDRITRLEPLKAMLFASALKVCANHHRLLPGRSR